MAYTYMRTHMKAYIHIYMSACVCVCAYAYACSCARVYRVQTSATVREFHGSSFAGELFMTTAGIAALPPAAARVAPPYCGHFTPATHLYAPANVIVHVFTLII